MSLAETDTVVLHLILSRVMWKIVFHPLPHFIIDPHLKTHNCVSILYVFVSYFLLLQMCSFSLWPSAVSSSFVTDFFLILDSMLCCVINLNSHSTV